jgi:hypothetical protein
MPVVDRRIDQASDLRKRIQNAANFREASTLMNELHPIELALENEHRQVMRVARGWVFAYPTRN